MKTDTTTQDYQDLITRLNDLTEKYSDKSFQSNFTEDYFEPEDFEEETDDFDNLIINKYTDIKESQQKIDELTSITRKIDTARKLDFNDNISLARQQLLEIRHLDRQFGTNVEKTYKEHSEVNFELDIEALKLINIYNLLNEDYCSPSWLVDFLNSSLSTIYQYATDTAGYRFVDGKLVSRFNPTKKNILQSATKVFNLNEEDYVHKKFIKLLESLIDWKYGKDGIDTTSSDITPLVIEEDLKKELLDTPSIIIRDNFDKYTIDDILEYHVYHYASLSEARTILESIKVLYNNGNTLQDIDNLLLEDDWTRRINIFLDLTEDEELDPTMSFENIETEDIYEEIKEESIKQTRKSVAKKGGKKKGKKNAAKSLTIRDKNTKEVYTFDTYKEAADFLGISVDSMKRFSEGKTKKNKLYDIL